MPRFGRASLTRLEQAHPDLKTIFMEVIQQTDCSILCSYRGKEEQEHAFLTGRSHARFGQSKHNVLPSLAVDAVPYPVDWEDLDSFCSFAEIVLAAAAKLEIPIIWGGSWTSIKDYPHFELAPTTPK